MWDGNSSRVARSDTGGGLGNEGKQEIAEENEDSDKNMTVEGRRQRILIGSDRGGDVESLFSAPSCFFLTEILNSEWNI